MIPKRDDDYVKVNSHVTDSQHLPRDIEITCHYQDHRDKKETILKGEKRYLKREENSPGVHRREYNLKIKQNTSSV